MVAARLCFNARSAKFYWSNLRIVNFSLHYFDGKKKCLSLDCLGTLYGINTIVCGLIMEIKLLSISCFSCLAFAFTANSAEPAEKKQNPVQPSSRQAYIDKTTGKLTSVPPGETQVQSRNVVKGKLQPIEYIVHEDGTIEAKLNGHYQSTLNVTLGCDGKLTKTHSTTAESNKNPETSQHDSSRPCDKDE